MLPCEAPESFLSTVSYTPVVKVTMTRPLNSARTHTHAHAVSGNLLVFTFTQ